MEKSVCRSVILVLHVIVPLVAAGISARLCAQPFTDIASITYQYHYPRPYEEVAQTTGKERGLEYVTGDLLLPFSMKHGSFLLIGGQYSRFLFHFETMASLMEHDAYTSLGLRGGVLYQWNNPKDKTLLLILPGWSGDKPWFRSQSFQMGGVALHTHRVSNTFAWRAGLYYNHEFFGNFFMPLLGLDWKVKQGWWVYGNLPGNLYVHKTFTPSYAVVFSYESPNGSLLCGDNGEYIRIGKTFPPYSLLQLELQWTAGRLVMKFAMGRTMWRHYGVYDLDNTHYTLGRYADYNNGFFKKAGIAVRVFDK